ncbi:hypothetical protein FACHB389_35275 [Nostoc calcicola FACHB-389]|nr:hypothetical protein FACHB389_35275 [Nostoc calcicola FACHB-389]
MKDSPLNIKRKYRVFYTVEDFDDVKSRVVETDNIEEWIEYFEGQEVDKTVDYYELVYPLNEC